jgi:hypothetical protein
LYLSLILVTVPNVAYPQAADINQPRNVISYRLIKMTQSDRERHPKTLREPKVIEMNGIAQAFDPACKRSVRKHRPPLPRSTIVRGGS